jgi:Bacterial Ig-like domain (group 2)
MSNILPKTKSGIPALQLKNALAEATKCGYGFNPKKGYIKLPNFNSLSGDIDGDVGLYIVNGAVEIDSIANVELAINNFCKNATVSATGVTISGCLVGTVLDGTPNTRQLTATVLPAGALQTGTWTSSVPTRATVDSSGLVTYVGATAGDTTITFTSTDGAYFATCVITVTED